MKTRHIFFLKLFGVQNNTAPWKSKIKTNHIRHWYKSEVFVCLQEKRELSHTRTLHKRNKREMIYVERVVVYRFFLFIF